MSLKITSLLLLPDVAEPAAEATAAATVAAMTMTTRTARMTRRRLLLWMEREKKLFIKLSVVEVENFLALAPPPFLSARLKTFCKSLFVCCA